MSAKLIQKGVSESSPFPILRAFSDKFGYLFVLVDHLEQSRAKFLRWPTTEDFDLWSLVLFYTYTHSLVRWKRTLAYLVPELHREFAFIEKLYRFVFRRVLYVCDRMHTFSRDKVLAAVPVILAFDEIKHLTKMERPNHSAVDHIQLALKARLKVLCSQIFPIDKRTSERKVSAGLMIMIIRVPELSFCLPPACQDYANLREMPLQGFLTLHVPDRPLDLSACLLRRSESRDSYYDDRQTDGCCCGWAFDSIRPSFLRLFGHSARSFARYVHFGPQKISLGDEDSAFDPCQALNAVWAGPWVDNSSLRRSMIVFASILSDLLGQLFIIIDYAAEKSQRDPDMAVNKDRLDRLAEYCRPQLFAHLLRSALTMYHEFWNTYKESVTAFKHHNYVAVLVYAWVRERQDSERDEFVSLVIEILTSSMSAETTKSDKSNSPSDEDSTQDELEKVVR